MTKHPSLMRILRIERKEFRSDPRILPIIKSLLIIRLETVKWALNEKRKARFFT